MPLWLIFSILSSIVLAGSELSQKISLTQKVNLSAITNNFYVWILQGTIGIILATIFGQFSLEIDNHTIIKLVLIGIIYFIGGTSFYSSYKGNSPSISIILGTISVIFSSLLGTVFLNDKFTLVKVLGISLILSAIIFLNFNKTEKLNKYNLFAIIGGISFGIAYTIDKSIATVISPFMYLGFMCFSVAIVSFILSSKLIIRETKSLSLKNFIPMVSSSSFGSAFNLFTFFSYTHGANVGISDAINNTSVFIVILLEAILLKDKNNLKRKIFAATIAILGVFIIGISK